MARLLKRVIVLIAISPAGCAPRQAGAPENSVGAGSASAGAPSAVASASSMPLGSAPPVCFDCGPAPAYPTGSCSDGVHIRGRGPCTKFVDGSCHWTHLVCPPAPGTKGAEVVCAAKDCGAAPSVAKWLCPDGVHTGELGPCVGDDQGHCGWAYRPCSGVAQGAGAPSAKASATSTANTSFHSCKNLPSDDELRKWEAGSICPPGGGPDAPPLTKLRDLGDGTFVFEGPYGCFRARYRKCTSK
jgi:hypothetical protein